MPDDNGDFQGLLGKEAPFPDISSKLPGVVPEDELVGPSTALEEEPEPAFETQSASALDNADIQVDKRLRAARTQVATVHIVVAWPNEIMYEVELGADEPDEGLPDPPTCPPIPNVAGHRAVRYPTQSRRSVLGNLPHDRYIQFLLTSGILNDVEHDQDS